MIADSRYLTSEKRVFRIFSCALPHSNQHQRTSGALKGGGEHDEKAADLSDFDKKNSYIS